MPSPTIRLATSGDAPAIAAIYAPCVEARATSFELVAPDADEVAARLDAVMRHWPWLVWCDGAGVQGYCYAGAHAERAAYRWSVNTTVYVAASHQRRGVGRALYRWLFDVLQRQGAVTAFAGITLPNEASLGLHRDLGFEPVGTLRRAGWKLGRWHDVAWMQRQISTPPADAAPPEPRPLPALRASGALDDLLGR